MASYFWMYLYNDQRDKVFSFRWSSLQKLMMPIVWKHEKNANNVAMSLLCVGCRNETGTMLYAMALTYCHTHCTSHCVFPMWAAHQYHIPILLSLLWQRIAIELTRSMVDAWALCAAAPFQPTGAAQLFTRIRRKHEKSPAWHLAHACVSFIFSHPPITLCRWDLFWSNKVQRPTTKAEKSSINRFNGITI